MRCSLLGLVLGFATLVASCFTSASAAPLANAATWITPLPGVNWHPAEDYVANSLRIESGVATLLFRDLGRMWRLRVDAQGQLLNRESIPNVVWGFYDLRAVDDEEPLLISSFSTDGQSVPYCYLHSLDSNLQLNWRHTVMRYNCPQVLRQSGGGVITESNTGVVSLSSLGEPHWERQWSEIGFTGYAQVGQWVVTASGRLLVLVGGWQNGEWRRFVWVLDSNTGQPLALHERPSGGRDTLAIRERPDQIIETLEVHHQNDQSLAEVSRWSAQGDFIGSSPLSSFSRLHSAIAHPAGFILYGNVATDTEVVRYYNGLELRWQATLPPGAAQDHLGTVEHEGALLISTYAELLRFGSDGQPLDPYAIEKAEPVYAEDGSLWILESRTLRYDPQHSFTLSRYAPGAAHASFRVPLQLPIRPMKIVDMRVDSANDLQVAGSLHADSALATGHRLQIQKVNSTGQFSMTVDREWPDYQIDAIHAVNSGWIVQSTARFQPNPELSERSWLRRLDAAGQLLWERQLPGYYPRIAICNGDDQCAVVFSDGGQVFQRFHIDGHVLSELSGSDANMDLHVEADRMFGIRKNGVTVSLLDLSVTPPQVLATVPQRNYSQYRPQRGRLLVRSPDGLSSHAGDQAIWSRPDIPETAQISTRQGRLHVALKPTGGPLRVLQLDPETGSTLSSIDLPPEFVRIGFEPVNSVDATALIDGAADGEQWVLADTAIHRRLLALTPGAPVRRFSHPSYITEIRAVSGAVLAMSGALNNGSSDTPWLRAVSRFTLDLFSDGFEAP